MTLTRRDRIAAVLVGGMGLALMTGGTAYAYWTTTGTGTGQAAATTASAISASPATVAGGLYPGATGVAGTVTVSNPNPFPVKVTAAGFAAPTATGGSGTCTTTGVTFTPQSLTTPVTVPAKVGATNGTATLNFTAAMDNTSQTGCQGATFTSTVTLTGTS